MKAGIIFTAVWSVLTMACNAWYAREVAATDGRSAAARTFTVLTLSLAAYVAVCVLVSFSFAGQLLALVASGAVLIPGRKYIVIPAHIRWLLSKKENHGDE